MGNLKAVKGFLHGIRAFHFRAQRLLLFAAGLRFLSKVLEDPKPKIVSVLYCLVLAIQQHFVFVSADMINGFIKVLADIKAAIHDIHSRQMPHRRVDVSPPHIHRNRLDLLAVLLHARSEKLFTGGHTNSSELRLQFRHMLRT